MICDKREYVWKSLIHDLVVLLFDQVFSAEDRVVVSLERFFPNLDIPKLVWRSLRVVILLSEEPRRLYSRLSGFLRSLFVSEVDYLICFLVVIVCQNRIRFIFEFLLRDATFASVLRSNPLGSVGVCGPKLWLLNYNLRLLKGSLDCRELRLILLWLELLLKRNWLSLVRLTLSRVISIPISRIILRVVIGLLGRRHSPAWGYERLSLIWLLLEVEQLSVLRTLLLLLIKRWFIPIRLLLVVEVLLHTHFTVAILLPLQRLGPCVLQLGWILLVLIYLPLLLAHLLEQFPHHRLPIAPLNGAIWLIVTLALVNTDNCRWLHDCWYLGLRNGRWRHLREHNWTWVHVAVFSARKCLPIDIHGEVNTLELWKCETWKMFLTFED